MSSPSNLVSLVVQSKKALQHGEQLCSRANALSNDTAQCAMDVLALDAKVKWISDAVLEQLKACKLAAAVAKSIEQKRSQLVTRAKDWDSERSQYTDALDSILESLGAQLVPPDFHQTSTDSSLFGSQHSDDEGDDGNGTRQGLAMTLRDRRGGRRTWKTLRDFVDERAIETLLETIETDRTAMDDILARTDDHPESLSTSVKAIRQGLPTVLSVPPIQRILAGQEMALAGLAKQLESLAAHYDQMARACRDIEAGETFSEEDVHEMTRDTEELPAIIAELEETAVLMEQSCKELLASRDVVQQQLDSQRSTLNDLEELGEIMEEMLQLQEDVETDFDEHLDGLGRHLLTLKDLHSQYQLYQTAFNRLLIEIARRRQYREAAELIIQDMSRRLEAMTDQEMVLRNEFKAEHGQFLPDDVCLCVENLPTRWEIVPCNGERTEVLPEIDNDLLVQAKDRLSGVEGYAIGLMPESL